MGVSSGSSLRYVVGALVCLASPLGGQGSGAPVAGQVGSAAAAAPYAALAPGETHAPQRQRITLDLRDVPLRDALKAVAAQGGAPLVYDSHVVPLDRRVSVRVTDVTAGEALRALLRDTDVEVRETGTGQLLLVRRARRPQRRDGEAPAPEGTLGGRVTDSATAAPVVSALVSVDGGGRRTTTNEQGRYRLVGVPAGARAVTVRRIGYAPATRSVSVPEGGEATLDVALAPVASRLDEVVTTVTGPQRRLEVGNAIGTIDADSVVREAPVTSLTDLINARVAGTQVVLNSGLTGTSPRIRIRGVNSAAASNDPLLYVDGVRVDNSTGSLVLGYGQRAGRFNDINPDEIASIEIVKGPSAATLYGTDAANGVIVVTTKRGRPGRARWNVYAQTGIIEQPARLPDNYYSWGHSTSTGAVQKCVLTAAAAGSCAIDSLTTFSPFNDKETTPIGTGRRGQYGVQTSGGVAQLTYFLSGDYEGETGYLSMPARERARVSTERGGASLPPEQRRPNDLRRVSLRSNVGASLGGTGDVALSTGFVSSKSRIPSNDVFFNGFSGPGYRDALDGWDAERPGEQFAIRNAEDVTRFTGSLTGRWQTRPWLSSRATLGGDFSSAFLDGLQRRDEGPLSSGRTGRRLNSRTAVRLYTGDVGVSALGHLSARATAKTSVGVQYNRRLEQVTTATGTNLPPGSQTVTGAAVVSGAEQTVESIVAGAYLEEMIGLRDRFFLTGALRADGAGSFGREFRTAMYPKASASWLLPLAAGSVRLRAAYGAAGVQPPPTAALALEQLFGALADNASVSAAVPSAIGNPGLKPERQSELETGADLDLWGDRLHVEATFYDRRSRDALINRLLGTDAGLGSRWENVGSVRNRGWEGALMLRPVDAERLTWELGLNGSVNRNKVLHLGPGVSGTASVREGYPLFAMFARPILGYSDANGNGILEASELRVGDTAVYVGQRVPPRQLVATSAVSLLDKRLRISTQFDYRGGHKLENNVELNRCFASTNCRAVSDPSASLADQAAALAFGKAFSRYGFYEDGAFVRWREMSVTYLLPPSLATRVRASSASLSLTARNLKLFTDFSGVDPEVNVQPGRTEIQGYVAGPTAPQARYWLLRLDVGL